MAQGRRGPERQNEVRWATRARPSAALTGRKEPPVRDWTPATGSGRVGLREQPFA